MEILLLVTILILIIILLNKNGKTPQNFQQEFDQLNNKIDALKKQISSLSTIEKSTIKEEITPTFKEVSERISTTIEPDEKETEQHLDTEKPIDEKISEEKTIIENDTSESKEISQVAFGSQQHPIEIKEKIIQPTIPVSKVTVLPKKSWLQNFKEKNPDIEKFIGENLINKIGILILVLGISFFVKYAIDKDWINEPARVGIGILCGTIVMGIAHRLRKKYAAFSSVFVAGAISIFYLTIGIAFHDYKLFSQTTAFIIMVIITIFSVFVSVSYDRKELAILSLIGGFAVPFMVSTGEGNYKILFTYIAILNVGMLIISYFKKWNVVTILAFIFTCTLYASWFGIKFSENNLPYKGALIYASLFYLIFSIAPFINNIKNKSSFSKLEYFILLANTFFFFGMGATIIENWKPDFKGIFTICLALYNLIFAIVFYRKFSINKNATYFLLGLALTFVTLTIPFQFSGNYITLFWSCEAVLLLWLSQKSKIETFRIGALIVQMLMIVSLLMDWSQFYGTENKEVLTPFFNKIFITGLVSLVSFIFTYFLLKKENTSTHFYGVEINPKTYRHCSAIASVIIGYFVGILEINYQSHSYLSNYYSAISYPVLFHFIFSVGLIFFLIKSKNKNNIHISLLLGSINILLYLFMYRQVSYSEMVENFNYNLNNNSALFIHYLLLACIAYFIYIIVKNRKGNSLSYIFNHKLALWVLTFCIVFILSNEVMIHGLLFSGDIINQADLAKKFPMAKDAATFNYQKDVFIKTQLSEAKIQIIKIGYPILWGILSFLFLMIGIKKQNKQLRIIALSLLGLTILKLFFYDIKNVSETGKIIAFILLGVLILIISFVYQKIKKLVIDEPQNNKDEENN